MFNSRRFEAPTASKDNYNFVTIHNPATKPAKVLHSEVGGGTVVVNCVLVVGKDGKPNNKEMISFRAQNKAALRAAIEEKYQASFSTTGTEEETNTVKSATAAKEALRQIREDSVVVTQKMIDEARNRLIRVYGREASITAEMCRKESISEQVFNALLRDAAQQYAADVTTEHRKLAAEMSGQERRSHTAMNVDSFVKESEWKDWFAQFNGNFFGYPDYSNRNYETLIAYCEAKGWTIPLFGELDKAMRYLLAQSHFFLQHTYPRTQRDAYRAVRPFVSIEPDVVPTDERQQVLAATKGLTSRELKKQLASARITNATEDELKRRGRLLR